MSDNWEAGDLALCIKSGRVTKAGRFYTVSEVVIDRFDNAVLLRFSGMRYRFAHEWSGADRFRKIYPHAPDAEDLETINLLKSAPVPEPVA